MARPERLFKEATGEEIAKRRDFHASLAVAATKSEVRSVGLKDADAWRVLFQEWGINSAISPVSIQNGQKLSLVYACLNVLGETVGSLPFDVKRNTEKGRVTDFSSPVYRLIHDRPNPLVTAFDFWSAIEKHKLAWGNAYAEIERGRNMQPVALWLRMPWEVEIARTPQGDVFYRYIGRDIRSTEMLHFKNYTIDGICGISVIKQNSLSIGMGLKLKEYNSRVIGERPPGFLTSETKPKDQNTKQNIQKMWNTKKEEVISNPAVISPERITVGTIGNIPILYGGVDFKELTLPADDVAFIESTNFNNKDILAAFRMPPTFVQDWEKAPYNSSEQQDLVFAKYTLASIREIEQECNEKLFPESNKTAIENLYTKFNLKGLLAGDTKTRQEFYSAMFNISVLNANEIREIEDMPTYEGGDDYYVQGALIPVKKIGEFIDSKIKASNNKAQSKQSIVSETKSFLRAEMKKKLNGHFKDVEELLQ